MNFRASNLQSGASRLWSAVALVLIAATISLFGRMNGLENFVYDYFQRYQYKSASNEIIMVTVDSRAEMQKNIWKDEGFEQVTSILRDNGARLIVATQPLSLPDVPDQEQVNALLELQRQAQRMNSGGELQLSGQFAEFRDRFERRETLIEELQRSSDIVLTTYTTSFDADNHAPQNCLTHEVNLKGAEANALAKVRRVRYLSTPPPRVCDSATAVGFSNFYPDWDGVVRSAELFVNADGIYLPSLALATKAALEGNNSNIIIASEDTFSLRDQMTRTSQGFQILNRYYNVINETPAFESVSLSSVLTGMVDESLIKNRIVLIGETVNGDIPGIQTPINNQMPPVEVMATSLSNVLKGDYLLRPNWLFQLETALIVLFVLSVWFWMPAMPTVAAAILGLVMATLVVSVEAWLLVSEGIWAQFATAATILAASIWTMHVWKLTAQKEDAATTPVAPKQRNKTAMPTPVGQSNEMDMEFSVLRQQTPNADVKDRLYELATAHIKVNDFARAERILSHIASTDPDYKDVADRLKEISGAREKKAAASITGKGSIATDRKTLGRYEIDRVLGRGAMATVYLGRDPAISRKVAIKTLALAREFDDDQLEEARQGFKREAESAGRLNHPNIIAIYDAGEDAEVSYLAMEYFEGNSLLEHVEANNLLPPSWVLELTARAAEALDYAHRQNVVHRDIKPANLLYYKATDTLKLTDFGIARLTDSSRTKTGVILGTPSYMSPEQLMGQGVTGQSDLYSLGITMYQLLTGQAPFRADSIPSLMDKIMNENHSPVREIRPGLPAQVDELVNKAIAKEPSKRFTNGREMALELRQCMKQFKKSA